MQFEELNQRDSRWKDIPLGTSKTTTIGSHGCTVTCVGVLSGLTPDEVNRRLLAVEGYANENLIIWSKLSEAIPWLQHEVRSWSYDNDVVKEAISNNGGCLVEVDFDGKISTPRDNHWVAYIGDRKMIDPWTGVTKSTGWYPLVKGYSIITVGEKPQVTENIQSEFTFLKGIEFRGHMVNTLKYLFIENKFSEGDLRAGMGTFKVGTVATLEKEIGILQDDLKVSPQFTLNLSSAKVLLTAFLNKIFNLSKTEEELVTLLKKEVLINE